jgi:hypothetical protein
MFRPSSYQTTLLVASSLAATSSLVILARAGNATMHLSSWLVDWQAPFVSQHETTEDRKSRDSTILGKEFTSFSQIAHHHIVFHQHVVLLSVTVFAACASDSRVCSIILTG